MKKDAQHGRKFLSEVERILLNHFWFKRISKRRENTMKRKIMSHPYTANSLSKKTKDSRIQKFGLILLILFIVVSISGCIQPLNQPTSYQEEEGEIFSLKYLESFGTNFEVEYENSFLLIEWEIPANSLIMIEIVTDQALTLKSQNASYSALFAYNWTHRETTKSSLETPPIHPGKYYLLFTNLNTTTISLKYHLLVMKLP